MKAHVILLVLLAWGASVLRAAEGQLPTPPAPAEPREMKLPQPAEKTLANGLRVVVVERPGLPLLSAEFAIKSGGEVDPPEAAGAMSMLSTLLMRGAGQRSARQLAEAIEALGGAIDTGAGWDATSARLTIMSPHAAAGLQLLKDAVRRPTLASAEVERLRAETLDELRVTMEEPGTLARAALARLIFGEEPYGHPLQGTPKSVARITRAQLVKLHATYFRPDNAVLVFAGKLTAAQGFAWAEQFFGDWQNPVTPLPPGRPAAPGGKPRTVIIDMPTAGQAAVLVGRAAITRKAPDYLPGLVANTVLGGGYSARLNAEIRVKRGLTYGARSELGAWRRGGCFVAAAQTRNSAGPEVATLMRAELDRLGAQPVPADELNPRTSTLTGAYGRALETNNGFVSELAHRAVQELPLSTLQAFPADVRAVKPEAVQTFAREHLRGADTCVVIAGKAEDFRASLERTFQDAVVIPQKDLDLEALDLRAPGSNR